MATFRSLWKSLVPRWGSEGESGLVGHVLMLFNDAAMLRLENGHLARFPQQGPDGEPGPDDALAALGRDRGVIKGIDETATSYAYRLTQWLVDARTRGTAFTMMKRLHDYADSARVHGMSFRIVDNRGNWYSRDTDGVQTASLNTGNWNWDAEPAMKWSRFWVIVYPGTRWVDAGQDWGDASNPWGGALATWGSSTITEEHTRTLQAIVADQKPDGTRCHTIILALDPASFDPTAPEPDGTWRYWGNRLTTALYLDGS